MSIESDEWEYDKARGLLDATGEEYREKTGFNNASEAMGHTKRDVAAMQEQVRAVVSGPELQKNVRVIRAELTTIARERGVYVGVRVFHVDASPRDSWNDFANLVEKGHGAKLIGVKLEEKP